MIVGTLRRGERGDDVEEMQRQLGLVGYRVRVDGDYGPRTQAAVAAFLREVGLPGDGSLLDQRALSQLETASRTPSPVAKVIPPLPPEVLAAPSAHAEHRDAIKADADHGHDVLGVVGEAKAFARMICSRRTATPLSIGLFGDWGTGKSFFLSKLREQVELRGSGYRRMVAKYQREGDAAGLAALEDRWHGRVAQISFNAWHFAEPNLWASLVTRVFDELAGILNPTESVEDTRARLLSEVSEGKERHRQADLELRSAEEALTQARGEKEAREQELERMRQELSVVEAAAPVTEADAEAEAGAASRTVLKVKGPWAALRISWRWIWSRGKWTRIGIIVGLVLALLGIVLAALAWWKIINLAPAIAVGTTCVGVVTGLSSTVVAYWAIVKPNLDKARAAYALATEGSAAVGSFLDGAARDVLSPQTKALDAARKRYDEAMVGMQSAQMATDLATEQVTAARRMIRDLQAGQRFYAFIQDRGASAEYRQHLGIVSMIRKDFAQLEKILRQVEREGPGDGAPAPISRIVLYIDDLDRCEPERVVEVLQAVHLLLATPIFVVVLAVDVRWLRRSLTLYYDRLLQYSRREDDRDDEGRPSPQHYLEKVFQIPFSLRPMGPEGFGALVDHSLRADFADEKRSAVQTEETFEAQARREAATAETKGDAGPGAAKTEAAKAETKPEAAKPEAAKPETKPDAAQRDAKANAAKAAAAKAELEDVPPPTADDVAELTADVALMLDPVEVEFAKQLHSVIETPRLAKALINTYRLLRAEIATDGIDEYLAAKAYRDVLTLLAIQVGRSTDAATLFEALSFSRKATLGEVVLELADDTTSDGEDRRWRSLCEALQHAQLHALTVPALLPWLDRVRRFSFNPWPTQSF